MMKGIGSREFAWIAPFVCVGLIALGLMRPKPAARPLANSRTVVDAEGTPVQIAMPYRGTALAWCVGVTGYLEATRAPESLLNIWGLNRFWFAHEVIGWIYPQVLRNDSFWNAKAASRSRGANPEIETLFAFDPGAYLGSTWGSTPLLRRVGLPALYLDGNRNTKNHDEGSYLAARVESALIGHPERGEALIASYRRSFADLKQELRPETLPSRPRVLVMGSSAIDKSRMHILTVSSAYQIYLPPAGVDNASAGHVGLRLDAERVLAIDPDIIFLMGRSDGRAQGYMTEQGPQEFMSDPRWRDLKAVREKRVYRMPGTYPGILAGLIFQPLWVRWMAEIAHPDRMQPRMRQVLRDRIMNEFGYRLSDDQIDEQLHLDENKGQPGYERFARNIPTNIDLGLPK